MRVNIAYETTPGDKIDGLLYQHLKYGRDVLRTKSGTCVNTSILFASVVEAAGLEAYIWVVPGHAFAGTRLPRKGQFVFVETTGCGGGTLATSAPFEEALKLAQATMEKYAPLGQVIEVNIRQLRRRGVQPPELANAGRNPLVEWNITPPPEGTVAVAPPPPTRKTAEDYFREGKELQQAKKWSEAETAFTKAIELDKNNAVYYNGRALLFMDLGDSLRKAEMQDTANAAYLKALDDVVRAVEIDPKFTRAWNNAGVICNRLGDDRKAIDFYTHAIACDPKNALAYRNRGKTWLKLGDKAKANADMRKADALEGK
jgi:tetratricopeptide (TPR) repeat protein